MASGQTVRVPGLSRCAEVESGAAAQLAEDVLDVGPGVAVQVRAANDGPGAVEVHLLDDQVRDLVDDGVGTREQPRREIGDSWLRGAAGHAGSHAHTPALHDLGDGARTSSVTWNTGEGGALSAATLATAGPAITMGAPG